MRLIDANEVLKSCVDEKGNYLGHDAAVVGEAVSAAPTVNAVPVVRCRECKHYEEAKLNAITSHDKVCAYAIDHRFYREPDDFCSKGERKGGDE